MRTYGYAYPWDVVGDPTAAERIAATGVGAVALAATYHTTRAATPFHPDHRMVVAEHAACYVPVRESVWGSRRLRPTEPTWVQGPDSFGEAAAALRGVGLEVHAWIVLTHNTLLGRANPDLAVSNAFGDLYEYALCPASAEVADYCSTLVAEILAQTEVDGVILEACGPLGSFHGGHHEKTDLVGWSAVQQVLLSLCFCAACETRYVAAGLDLVEVKAVVRRAADADAGSMAEALGVLTEPLLEVRTAVSGDVQTRLVQQVRDLHPQARVTLHASADPWATGAFPALAASTARHAPLDAVVANCWNLDQGAASLAGLHPLVEGKASLGGYVRPDLIRSAGVEPGQVIDRYRDLHLTELHLYHLGLLAPPALRVLADLATVA